MLIHVNNIHYEQSTLLQCILGELKTLEGSVEVNGNLSYASQKPWVFSGSIRENILFGSPYHQDWYRKVIHACALNKVRMYILDCMYLGGRA